MERETVFERGKLALRQLLDAHDYALEASRTSWDFAVEIRDIRKNCLTSSDIRWLMCKGFVEHAQDVTRFGEGYRTFQNDGGLRFSKDSCFILTDTGASYMRRFLDSATEDLARTISSKSAAIRQSKKLLKPKWNRYCRELKVGDASVKQFKVPAPNQEVVLAVFQEEGWPGSIDDPLPAQPDIDPKQRLLDTINSLNRNQKNRLIHFRGNGSGQGILWELVPALNGHATTLDRSVSRGAHQPG